MSFWAYILRCADGSYYIGHTEDLDVRLAQHQRGTLKGYTHDRRPVELVWSEAFESRYEALSAERQIKGWSRAKKEALIAGDWEQLSLLARNRQGPPDLGEAIPATEMSPSTSSGRTVVGEVAPSKSVRPELVEGPAGGKDDR